jgi:glutathione peroxidase
VSIYEDVSIGGLDGQALDLRQFDGKATLIVNVASRCGLTPQYAGLEQLQQIAEFCSATYGVSFPMTEKVDVNGPARHPLYERLTSTNDPQGKAGDIQWNFEKFLVSPGGDVIARFRPQAEPLSAHVTAAIEAALPHS